MPFDKVLVAGGAGFIGANLCSFLLERGCAVTCLDNLYTGSLSNVAHHLESPLFSFVNADVRRSLVGRGDLSGFSIVFNLACPASPVKYQEDPILTTLTSVVGTKNLLDLALEDGSVFIQASTSEVYGDPTVHPQNEQYYGNVNPIGPRSCYDEGKRAAESLVFDYRRIHGLETKVARIFNTYGPLMALDDGRVVSNFITQGLKGKTFTVYGHGRQTRSFCFVDDLVQGLWLLARSAEGFSGPVNLGNPEEISIKSLAEEVAAIVGCKACFEFLELSQDDPTRRKPDISLARTALGWSPKRSLKEGLEVTVGYFRDAINGILLSGRNGKDSSWMYL